MLGGVIPWFWLGGYSIGRMEWSSYVILGFVGLGCCGLGDLGGFGCVLSPAGGRYG